MHDLDPRGWRDWGGSDREEPDDPNLDRVLHCGILVAGCLCLASFSPLELMPLAAAGLLHSAAIAMVIVAIFEEDGFWAPTLTRWDEAAACLMVSLSIRLLAPMDAATSLPAVQP